MSGYLLKCFIVENLPLALFQTNRALRPEGGGTDAKL